MSTCENRGRCRSVTQGCVTYRCDTRVVVCWPASALGGGVSRCHGQAIASDAAGVAGAAVVAASAGHVAAATARHAAALALGGSLDFGGMSLLP